MENIRKSIFKIITASGTGSGFVVSGINHVITNYHVVAGEKTVAVEDYKKDRYVANVIMVNPEVDLAMLFYLIIVGVIYPKSLANKPFLPLAAVLVSPFKKL